MTSSRSTSRVPRRAESRARRAEPRSAAGPHARGLVGPGADARGRVGVRTAPHGASTTMRHVTQRLVRSAGTLLIASRPRSSCWPSRSCRSSTRSGSSFEQGRAEAAAWTGLHPGRAPAGDGRDPADVTIGSGRLRRRSVDGQPVLNARERGTCVDVETVFLRVRGAGGRGAWAWPWSRARRGEPRARGRFLARGPERRRGPSRRDRRGRRDRHRRLRGRVRGLPPALLRRRLVHLRPPHGTPRPAVPPAVLVRDVARGRRRGAHPRPRGGVADHRQPSPRRRRVRLGAPHFEPAR